MPIKESVTLDEAVDYFNDLAKRDKQAIWNLLSSRIPVTNLSNTNSLISEDCPAQCMEDENGNTVIGLLGILNGIFGMDESGWGGIQICYEVKEDGSIDTLVFEKRN